MRIVLTAKLVLAFMLIVGGQVMGVETTQVLELTPGWNAVWLDVTPRYAAGDNAGEAKAPTDVFTDSAIEMVVRPTRALGTAEFLAEGAVRFNQDGWSRWTRSSALETHSLATVRSNAAYLIYVSGQAPVSLTVTGDAVHELHPWGPDSYNLFGFRFPGTEPTFGEFFGQRTSHSINKIFRLQADGSWGAVTAVEAMTSNEAYWIYSEGKTDFNDAMKVVTEGTHLNFGTSGREMVLDHPMLVGERLSLTVRELTVGNRSGQTGSLAIVRHETASPADPIGLYHLTPATDQLSMTFGASSALGTLAIANLDSGRSRTVTLGLDRNWQSGERVREALYRIDFAYHSVWLPVRAENASVAGTPDAVASYTGLWVGEVNLNRVTSLNDAGVRDATTQLPLRVLLHVATDGRVQLLSQVTMMQTKTADATELPSQVLVVDANKVPFFEGVKERDGKKMGIRLQTIGYDMPRKADATTQAALYGSHNLLNTQGFRTWLNGQSSRPPTLVDSYELSWPLSGAAIPGGTLETGANPLWCDPFHRANPFRHAFHPQHGAGYPISRSVKITFDSRQLAAETLAGTYEETVSGLAAQGLTLSGPIRLERISEIGEIQ